MDAAGDHGCGEVVRAGHHVGNNLGLLRIGDARLEHADYGGSSITHGPAAEAHGLTDHRGIFSESGCPEAVGENDDAGGLGSVVLRADETAEDRMEAHHVKERPANHAALNFARLTES